MVVRFVKGLMLIVMFSVYCFIERTNSPIEDCRVAALTCNKGREKPLVSKINRHTKRNNNRSCDLRTISKVAAATRCFFTHLNSSDGPASNGEGPSLTLLSELTVVGGSWCRGGGGGSFDMTPLELCPSLSFMNYFVITFLLSSHYTSHWFQQPLNHWWCIRILFLNVIPSMLYHTTIYNSKLGKRCRCGSIETPAQVLCTLNPA